ncbi:hypothetical protein BCV70DRAFT_201826 [Testicularia cyperi]|uniref:PWI domain-containing protein n=1 Tax=Testicularia cyperi TaxID=1882483 RepID=A0A317XJQ8_9BASI|nr:hypothetical protein BCV70DRAFT_201826 [Testicularia cyperi]
MGDSGYKGVSASQDSRFKNKDSALLRSIKFPANFDCKVDMRKVELAVFKPWISQTVTELLGFEDEVVLEYASGMLEEERFPDPKRLQIQLTGFLEGQTAKFVKELWTLLLSAQDSPDGIPQVFVDKKKEELRIKREEEQKVIEEAKERARQAAESSSRIAASASATRRQRGSRWDTGAPPPTFGGGAQDHHVPRYNGPPAWRGDRNGGHTSDRTRDSGWGARGEYRNARQDSDAPRIKREDEDDRHQWSRGSRHDESSQSGRNRDRDRDHGRERDSDRPRHSDAARRRRSSDRNDPPRARDQPSDRHRERDRNRDTDRGRHHGDRARSPARLRSRSRSVTPDYREAKREARRQKDREIEQTLGVNRESEDTKPTGDTTPKFEKRARKQIEAAEDSRINHADSKRRRSQRTKWDDGHQSHKPEQNNERAQSDHDYNLQREQELRAKLLRAKRSQS